MAYGDLSIGVTFDMRRESPFSYVCGGCGRCCHGKAIRVGPYEILRLARHLGLSTSEFIARHTTSGGTILKSNGTGDCGFLNDGGCSVHAARPLACRLYPLGMQVSPEGEEHFGQLAPHAQTEGMYGQNGTVGDFLGTQGAVPFIAANQAYEKLYDRMVRMLALIDPDILDKRQARRDEADDMGDGTLISNWMDIDAVLGENAHTTPEAAIDRHIAALAAKVDALADDFD